MSRTFRQLFRSSLREAGRLPEEYLRCFWRLKIRDSFRTRSAVKDSQLFARKIEILAKELKRLQAANYGNLDAVRWVLATAYARRGKLRGEIISNITEDPNTPPRDPIIPQQPESSRLAKLPLALISLFGFAPARGSRRILSSAALHEPPTLPARADLTSQDARLLGPLSLRRRKNIHQRFFRTELEGVLPPLEIHHRGIEIIDGKHVESSTSDRVGLRSAGVRTIGLEETGVFSKLEQLAKKPVRPLPRYSVSVPNFPTVSDDIPPSSRSSSSGNPVGRSPRFMRRRYQEVLAQTPILHHSVSQNTMGLSCSVGRTSLKARSTWTPSLSPRALRRADRLGSPCSPGMSSKDRAWVERSASDIAAGKPTRRH